MPSEGTGWKVRIGKWNVDEKAACILWSREEINEKDELFEGKSEI